MSAQGRIDSAFLRGSLASSGIFLDDPPAAAHRDVKPENVPALDPEPDRDAIRAALVEAGAPAQDLDWLTVSAPSVETARAYRPTVAMAWCAVCSDAVAVDARGCIACQRFQFTPRSEA